MLRCRTAQVQASRAFHPASFPGLVHLQAAPPLSLPRALDHNDQCAAARTSGLQTSSPNPAIFGTRVLCWKWAGSPKHAGRTE